MSEKHRLVIDTNVIVSAVLTPEGKPRRCLEYVLDRGVLLLSDRTQSELLEVLYRPRLQRYITESERAGILGRIAIRSEHVETEERIRACRDPRDDKFLEAAVSGEADYLVSGDDDLLVLHPFRGIPILTPAAFLALLESRGSQDG